MRIKEEEIRYYIALINKQLDETKRGFNIKYNRSCGVYILDTYDTLTNRCLETIYYADTKKQLYKCLCAMWRLLYTTTRNYDD